MALGVLVRHSGKTLLVAKIGEKNVWCEINRGLDSPHEIAITDKGLVFPIKSKNKFMTKVCVISFRSESPENS